MTVALATVARGDVETAVEAVIDVGRYASSHHWVPATSGNFSVRIDESRIAITRSGVDKGFLTALDVLIQPLGDRLLPGSSAEAALHVRHYRDDPAVGAIFHIHGPYSTVLSRVHLPDGAVRISGWELQKALAGITTHEAVVEVPVFDNDQEIEALSNRVAARLAEPATQGSVRAPGYLLAGHGLYAWGKTVRDAYRHLEAFEVLFSQIAMLRSYQP